MSNNFILPRQAGSKITTIDGKRCTAVRRSDIPQATSAPPTSAAPVRTSAISAAPVQQQTTERQNASPASPPSPTSSLVTSLTSPAPAAPPVVVSETSVPPVVVPSAFVSTSEAIPTQALTTTPVFLSPGPTPEAISDNTSGSVVPALEALESSIDPLRGESQSGRQTLPTPTPTSIDRDKDEAGSNTLPPESSTLVNIIPSSTHIPSTESTSLPAIITATSRKSDVGPIVGGVVGTVVLVAIVGVMIFFCRRRRRGESLLSPLSTGTLEKFYEIDNGSVGPTRRTHRWKQETLFRAERWKLTWTGIATSLKSKLSGGRSDTPSVDLNRGNSQFFHTSVATHSRNNSSIMSGLASTRSGGLSARDRFEDWWERFTERWRFSKREDESVDPFANPRSMYEKQASVDPASTSAQLVALVEREQNFSGHSRNSSLTAAQIPKLPQLEPSQDPFADPFNPFADPTASTQSQSQHWLPPKNLGASSSNPFADSISAPTPSLPKPQSYVAAVRRSRVPSSAANPGIQPNLTRISMFRSSATSRYPSTIAPSSVGDSDRDTVLSYFSGVRKGKGRSDPFDLERPELRFPSQDRSGPPLSHQTQNYISRGGKRTTSAQVNDVTGLNYPDTRAHSRKDSSFNVDPLSMAAGPQRATYTSQYSSGVESLGDWGDPGPDIGDNSPGFSLRGNASTRDGGSGEYDRDATDIYGVNLSEGKGYGLGDSSRNGGSGSIYSNENINGSLAEFQVPIDERTSAFKLGLERRRELDNVSPVSPVSPLSATSVGKAL